MALRFPGIPPGGEAAHVDRLQDLVDSIRRYGAGRGPTEAELAAAPVIAEWAKVPDLWAMRLLGRISGHPLIGPGAGVTSQVMAIDLAAGWMRSSSRLWRLGAPAHHPKTNRH